MSGKTYPKFTILLLTLLFLLFTPLVWAQAEVTPTEAMQAGNDSYESGDFGRAIDIYQAIAAAGIEDSSLYFNLGNAWFKQGDVGRAILNYRRAFRLNPRDADIKANLAIARLQTLDRLDAAEAAGLSNLVQTIEEWLTLREAALLALLLWLIVSFLMTVAIISESLRKYSLWAAAFFGVFLIIGLASIANRTYTEAQSPGGVVVAPEVDVTSGPGTAEQYVVEFNLHAGAEVSVIDSRPGWRRIALPGNNFQGWLPQDAVEVISPGGAF